MINTIQINTHNLYCLTIFFNFFHIFYFYIMHFLLTFSHLYEFDFLKDVLNIHNYSQQINFYF